MVHRDLKPANVLLSKDGEPKITDFGLARLDDSSTRTEVGTFLGTLAYMAPEQARGKTAAVGTRTDIQRGAILYEALTGRPPYRADTPENTLHKILLEDVLSPTAAGPESRAIWSRSASNASRSVRTTAIRQPSTSQRTCGDSWMGTRS